MLPLSCNTVFLVFKAQHFLSFKIRTYITDKTGCLEPNPEYIYPFWRYFLLSWIKIKSYKSRRKPLKEWKYIRIGCKLFSKGNIFLQFYMSCLKISLIVIKLVKDSVVWIFFLNYCLIICKKDNSNKCQAKVSFWYNTS